MGTYQSRKVAHKAKRDKILGTVCCNCGKDVGKFIEYHHIVPLELGGKDILSNLAPICPECHSIITFGKKRKRPANGGRKRKVYDPQLMDDVFWKYVRGEIMELDARKLLGTGCRIRDMIQFKEWAEQNGINLKDAHFGRGGPQRSA